MKNPHAVALGRKAKGVKKNVSLDEREARRKRMAEARKNRWK